MKIKLLSHQLLRILGLNKREGLPPVYFQPLVEEVIYTYAQFRFNRLGHREIAGKIYQNNEDNARNFKTVWDLILVSFLICYILGLDKIFDRKNYGKKNTFCIYHFVRKAKFKTKKETINKISKARNEIVAHLDAKVREEPMEDGLLARYGLTPEDIDSLFGDIFNYLNEVKDKYNYEHVLEKNKNDKDVEEEFNKWFVVFKKIYGENIANGQNASKNTDKPSVPTGSGSAYIVRKTGSPMSQESP